jgi:hypothetical protein
VIRGRQRNRKTYKEQDSLPIVATFAINDAMGVQKIERFPFFYICPQKKKGPAIMGIYRSNKIF